MADLITLFSDPATWAALLTLIVMEVVLGIDNLVFVAILANKLPAENRDRVRRIGIGLALVMRLGLLSAIAWIVGLIHPVFDLGITGALDAHGVPSFETAFSWRDIILLIGGLFLMWKATTEIHHSTDEHDSDDMLDKRKGPIKLGIGTAIVQIVLLDIVFSVDSILTAVGMTSELPIMVVAVIVAVALMLVAAGPLGDFINRNPSVVMLALGFLLMIGMVLIAESLGMHIPKGYIYVAMAFSAGVESLNMRARNVRSKNAAKAGISVEENL
jgi:predicted tellurium resistance membrane protein TerC